MIEPQVQWTTPAPLWAEATAAGDPEAQLFRRPAVVRFATDTFMDDFLALLQSDPARLGEFRAAPETWRRPAPAVAAVESLPALPRALAQRRFASPGSKKLSSPVARNEAAELASADRSATGLTRRQDRDMASPGPLKLYQPAHQRFYLLAACLVCRIPGLPDRLLDTGSQERVSFVVRRVVPSNGVVTNTAPDLSSADEYALMTTATGHAWQKIPTRADVETLIPGEEQLPLFGVSYIGEDGRKRRLLAGMVPVGKREVYLGAGQAPDAMQTGTAAAPAVDTRKTLVRSQVIEPWKSLLERADAVQRSSGAPSGLPSTDAGMPDDAKAALFKTTRDQLQVVAWYLLLDFANYLKQYVPQVWQAVMDVQEAPALAPGPGRNLFDALQNTRLPSNLKHALTQGTSYKPQDVLDSLRGALRAVGASGIEGKLESVTAPYDRQQTPLNPAWPGFVFPLADPGPDGGPLPPPGPPQASQPGRTPSQLDIARGRVDNLGDLIDAALPAQTSAAVPAVPLAALPVMNAFKGWFVMRCVFERPLCGPLRPTVVSAPTDPFQLAGFFDPDAPARPIRIALPIDTSPAGLRKFDKNTAFMISDMLCGQIDRVKGMSLGDLVRSVLPWPLHKDLSTSDGGPCTDPGGNALGMICSLSIPIITICALILLLIIVNLLDIIFRWVPFFIMCFPLPNFKSKE